MTALSGICTNTYGAHKAVVFGSGCYGVKSGNLHHHNRVYFCRIGKSRLCLKHHHEHSNRRCGWPNIKGRSPPYYREGSLLPPPLAVRASSSSTDDGVTVNGAAPMTSSSGEAEDVNLKLEESLQGRDANEVLVQAIHDAARAVELAIREHTSLLKSSWFSRNWLGVDKNSWIKALSYQAAVYSLLQAAIEKSSLERDKDVNHYVQKSLLRLSVTLESTIQEQLCNKDPKANEWFWSQEHPIAMKTFTDLFNRDICSHAATMSCWKSESSDGGSASDLSLLILALSCLAAIFRIGSTKISCSQFYSILPDVAGKLMDMLLNFLQINKVYSLMKDIGLRREFLFHFGPRAAIGIFENVHGIEEITFWVDLVQNHLQQAVDREKIWSRLTTCESIEVLEKDLAIFGFFIALGRSTQTFLSSNGLTTSSEKLGGIIRYLIGGSILYYPQLSSISSYQLYVEVVCEELEWLPFYCSSVSNATLDNKGTQKRISDREAISLVLHVCFYWMTSFIKHSKWLQNPSHIKAATFLSRGHDLLKECLEELDVPSDKSSKDMIGHRAQSQLKENLQAKDGLKSIDKALESVEEALNRLEDLLQELHLSNSNLGKEHLQAACSDLEKIRRLKKEAEFLEASFRAKAASLEQGHIDGRENVRFQKTGKSSASDLTIEGSADRTRDKPSGFWSFLVHSSNKRHVPGQLTKNTNVSTTKLSNQDSESNEISRFEQLRHELIELEKRVQRSTAKSLTVESDITYDNDKSTSPKDLHMLVPSPKKENVIAKSMEKIRETTTDVLQGTQLLAIDVSAALVLLKRAITGDELTEKEKKALQRTLTDLASVIPIGFLMLLPVTAVGHAAILAFIQRYVPSMIPSTYAPERLDLLRQLAKVKELETANGLSDKVTDSVKKSVGTAE